MNFKVGDSVILSPSFYHDKLLVHTIRGTVKQIKWNMILIQFNNGQAEWIESKYLHTTSTSRGFV